MKIALLGPYPPPLGGVSINVLQLARCLRTDGYQVEIFVEEQEQANTSPVAAWYSPWTLRPSRNQLFKVREFQPDIIHSHSSTVRTLAALLAWVTPAPLIHQIFGERFPEQFKRWNLAHRLLSKWALRQAQIIIPASHNLAQFIISLGVKQPLTTIIPCLLPLENYDYREINFPDRIAALLNDPAKIVIVTSGFYERHYGFSLIPLVAVQLQPKKIDFTWIVVGQGSAAEIQALRTTISDAGIDDQVILAGEVDRLHMLALLNRAHIYLRTKYSDSFGIVIAEAHQLGCYCLFGDNNPYFRSDGVRLFAYRTGEPQSIVSGIQEIITQLNPGGPRDRHSKFRQEARANYEQIKELYHRLQPED